MGIRFGKEIILQFFNNILLRIVFVVILSKNIFKLKII